MAKKPGLTCFRAILFIEFIVVSLRCATTLSPEKVVRSMQAAFSFYHIAMLLI